MIDELARELAAPMPRRRALRLLAAAIAATAVPGLRPHAAHAVTCGGLGCSGKCCSQTDWMTPGLQGVCCGADEICCGPIGRAGSKHQWGWCCSQGWECGQELDECVQACVSPRIPCGSECCHENGSCCFVTEDDPICCPEGVQCVKQILPGNIGITADSPRVCCPEEQLVTATGTAICCPLGSVRQPGGGLSTGGGLCCTAGNVCGEACCDSSPSFPQRCVGGRCEFMVLVVEEDAITTQKDGRVVVPVEARGPVSGSVSIVAASAGGARASAAGPQTLGRARLKAGRRGRRKVRIRLSRKGRAALRRRGRLRVEVVVTLRSGTETARTSTPVTLRARR